MSRSAPTATPDDPSPSRPAPGRWYFVLNGAAAGLVAGLLLTALQVLARLLFGVAPPAELIGDRIAPLLSIDQFFGLFDLFGGYNALKKVGVGGNTAGQLAVAVLLGVGYALLVRRRGSDQQPWRVLAALTGVFLLGLVVGLWPNLGTNFVGLAPGPARLATLLVMGVTFAVFPAAVIFLYRLLTRDRSTTSGQTSPGRRALLVGGIGVGLAAVAGVAGDVLYRRAVFDYDGTQVPGPSIDPITPNDKFYTVTKNVVDPRVNAGLWSFTLGGAVDRERSLGLDELTALPSVNQETTLMCISNGVGGGLESNAVWTGVRLADLISGAGPHPGVVEVLLTAVDGYTDTFAIAKALEPTTLIAYRMNGEPLPDRHGYPARVIVPGMFGEKNVKWVTRIDLVTEETKGFYETQGWGPNFVIPTRSRFTSHTSGQLVPAGRALTLAGTAYGGDRGVAKVEVSLDDGASWREAGFSYPGSRLTWALWRYDWRPPVGESKLVVRATDGEGGVQTSAQGGPPEGATGYHRIILRAG